jgi:hypothetical protein
MYRRPKFLEVLLEIRREMALEADYDVDLFAEIARSGNSSSKSKRYRLEPAVADADKDEDETDAEETREVTPTVAGDIF